jgi:hypothetical protein
MRVRSVALVALLFMWTGFAFCQDGDQLIEKKTIKGAVSVHVGDSDSRSDTFRYAPPEGYHIKDYQVAETSKYGDASYTVKFEDGVISIPWTARSQEVKALGVTVDTHTASLQLDVTVTLEKNPPPPTAASTIPAQAPSVHVPADSQETSPERTPGRALSASGILALGLFMGLLAALVLFAAKTVGLKFAAGVVGLVLTGAPIALLPSASWLRLIYPIGLLLGLLAFRLVKARLDFGTDPQTRKAFAVIDTVAIVIIIAVVAVLVIVWASHA